MSCVMHNEKREALIPSITLHIKQYPLSNVRIEIFTMGAFLLDSPAGYANSDTTIAPIAHAAIDADIWALELSVSSLPSVGGVVGGLGVDGAEGGIVIPGGNGVGIGVTVTMSSILTALPAVVMALAIWSSGIDVGSTTLSLVLVTIVSTSIVTTGVAAETVPTATETAAAAVLTAAAAAVLSVDCAVDALVWSIVERVTS